MTSLAVYTTLGDLSVKVAINMAGTDLQNLLDMGFERERAELAMKSTGSRRCVLKALKFCHLFHSFVIC